jgi:hypothetical protein
MKITFVIYINVGSMDSKEISDNCYKILKDFKELDNDTSTVFIVPIRTGENKIECINPVYITNEKLIEEHEEALKNLTKKLNEHV